MEQCLLNLFKMCVEDIGHMVHLVIHIYTHRNVKLTIRCERDASTKFLSSRFAQHRSVLTKESLQRLLVLTE